MINRAHSVIDRAHSCLALRPGAWIIGLAVMWMAAAPRAAWGQWIGTNPVYTYNNVGIGTASPRHLLGFGYGGVTSDGSFGIAINNGAYWSSAWKFQNANYKPSGILMGAGGTIQFYSSDMTGTADSQILDWTPKMSITSGGNVGIGTTSPGSFRLAVEGTIGARDVMVTNAYPWPDYVFRPSYRLRPLSEISAFIQANGHLPEIPTEAEVKEKGVSLGDMQAKLLAKVEELTLHMIQADERNNRLERQNQELRERISRLETGSAR